MALPEEQLDPWVESTNPSWWQSYLEGLPNLTPTARLVLESDCRFILDLGVLGSGPGGSDRWPSSRVRRGLVMGAVQSGKTASLLGVAARAMDAGTDVVVVLAGTRISLWRQTLSRLQDALRPGGTTGLRWSLRPETAAADSTDRLALNRLYGLGLPAARRALSQGRPIVLVAMKQVDHLRALGQMLREEVVEAAHRLDKPIHLLVLDDEADDGSILDARAEADLDPALAHLKQIPRHIVDLWDSRPHAGATLSPNVFVTYCGYTATPQANFLQSDQNPLAPTDFVASLRTPLDVGAVDLRSTTYAEPDGPTAYYSGGELFYRRLGDARLCLALTGPNEDDELAEAIRAYLVAGSLRRLGTSNPASEHLQYEEFASRLEAEAASPEPHSMLIHPAAAVASHFETAARVVAWFGGLEIEQARDQLGSDNWSLALDGVIADIESQPERWMAWLTSYRQSASDLASSLAWLDPPSVVTEWEAVRKHLLAEFLPSVRLSVVNSDPRTDDRPQFEVWEMNDRWHAPRDLSTIFVSGNVMARGLTLEGLTTTYFLRSSKDPYADTQMQMQRWFGYRGHYLHLCRVFLPAEQLALFRSYHDVDEALRRDVIAAMNDGSPASPQVLQGRAYAATGKIVNLANQPLSPGPDPVVQLLGDPHTVDPNLLLVAELFSESSREIRGSRRPRGRLLERDLSLTEVADLLDRLRYTTYKPGANGWLGDHWSGVERQVDILATDDRHHPLYRPPAEGAGDDAPLKGACPYRIAAYLRLWDACLSRHARGLYPTDRPDLQWSLVDLAIKQAEAPRFRVGLRFGAGQPVREGGAEVLPFVLFTMDRATNNGYLEAEWGARTRARGGYEGDQSFDLPEGAVDGGRRGPGAPGLILFQVIDRPPGHPGVAVGLVIPRGGPDHFAARTGVA